ncbi:MAG: translation elongation factor Ts [Actinobacteria bacterium]|nr:translation elongation factor Ts [Actinomycetota bacterium]
MVKELREKTGAGMMDCKKALTETGGDLDQAVDFLRKKGLGAAEKKAARVAAEGIVDSYIHAGGKVGVLVEANCETDFVAKTDEFREFVHDVALQIAAMNPRYVSKEDVPAEVIEHEKEILREQAKGEGKPAHIIDKMVEGRLEKFYKEVCLLEQTFVKDPEGKLTIGKLLTEKVAKIGEKITVRRFVRFQMGEGLEKKKDDLGGEVAKLLR